MVGTVQGRGNHCGRPYPGAEGEKTDKACETAVPAEQYHYVRYRCIYDWRKTELRGCVKSEGLAGIEVKEQKEEQRCSNTNLLILLMQYLGEN